MTKTMTKSKVRLMVAVGAALLLGGLAYAIGGFVYKGGGGYGYGYGYNNDQTSSGKVVDVGKDTSKEENDRTTRKEKEPLLKTIKKLFNRKK